MSVIWSGVTEGGAIVPVQVTDAGKVIADVNAPEPDDPLWTQNGDILTPAKDPANLLVGGSISLSGSNSGSSILKAPANAGNQEFTFPETGGELMVSGGPAPDAGKPWAFASGFNGTLNTAHNVRSVTMDANFRVTALFGSTARNNVYTKTFFAESITTAADAYLKYWTQDADWCQFGPLVLGTREFQLGNWSFVIWGGDLDASSLYISSPENDAGSPDSNVLRPEKDQ